MKDVITFQSLELKIKLLLVLPVDIIELFVQGFLIYNVYNYMVSM